MPPLRTLSSIKSAGTERTHEENQERAYIAASRRSDRSLEARVESARRASKIHKRRTGRLLRFTEQDVANEEMYEEEDDDLPMQYRRLTAHLQSQNLHFERRLQAYVAQQVAMRTGDWVQEAYLGSDQKPFLQPQQFTDPGMTQTQQPFYQQYPKVPPQHMHRAPPNYRQSPHPMLQQQQAQGTRPQRHNRSTSIATPQGYPAYQQRHPQSIQANIVGLFKVMDQRKSMPTQQIHPQTPHRGHQPVATPQQLSPAISRLSSSSQAATPQECFQHSHSQWREQASTPPPRQFKLSISSPFNFEQSLQERTNPLSMELPMDSQQLLAERNAFGIDGV
ncbi:hypothetical protein D0869_13304 [Hortaea werneckii]|uniref:Uncharacterized protein n=1 Tax=Hortaea werneckii TaxID=91943 RepID=A0A3M6W5A0_HORWE|nr:hypothetical protein KC324_g10861 [Hortaea werneckii]KAI7362677.1 hypothetical protein KC354_g7089 [Hortaea werneckii]KAI7575699.1 hypothetical protein KC316_g10977 [Hortaea werneckii]RMX73734.1 hypothetical protein D0869_13304 [Hortaea werneckii]RMY08879.1 hypothetical protein D0868_04549 [Hortaea werneckii]